MKLWWFGIKQLVEGVKVECKKIVIISRATEPSNTPRSLRTAELSKELARQGHDVTLYVLLGGYDYKKYEDITKLKIRSLGPTRLFDYDHDVGEKMTLPVKAIRKLFGRYFELPTIELVFNTYKALQKESDIDLLITIAVPYPIHWGAALYKTRFLRNMSKTVWVADCGDPYMGNAFHKKPFYFRYIEKWFCRKADYISVPVAEAKAAYYPEFHSKIKIIPQGFNLRDVSLGEYKKNQVPTFIYAGIFYKNKRDPTLLLEYLLKSERDFKFTIYTKTPELASKYVAKLGGRMRVLPYISRDDLIFEMSKADFLVNIENPSSIQSPSKLIDYKIAGRPVLNVKTSNGLDDELVEEFLNGIYDGAMDLGELDQYDIENVAKKFLELKKISA